MPCRAGQNQCLRSIVIISNEIFVLFGLAILGLGIYIEVSDNFNTIIAAANITEALGGTTMKWIGVIMIVVGIMTVILAVFGLMGAAYRNRLFLNVYVVLLILIIMLEFGAVIVTLKYRNDLWQSYDSGFDKVFVDAYRWNRTETINVIENLERQFKCCGVNSSLDYTSLGFRTPRSCYPKQIPIGLPFNQGCATAVGLWIWNQSPIIAGVLGSILLSEIFGVISSLVLGVVISHTEDYDAL